MLYLEMAKSSAFKVGAEEFAMSTQRVEKELNLHWWVVMVRKGCKNLMQELLVMVSGF